MREILLEEPLPAGSLLMVINPHFSYSFTAGGLSSSTAMLATIGIPAEAACSRPNSSDFSIRALAVP